jgi:chemotaxis protein MotB
LAFFVVMYAISSVNEGKYRVVSDSLFAAFRGSPRTLQPVQVGEKQVGSGADIQMTIVQQAMLEGQPRSMLEPSPIKIADPHSNAHHVSKTTYDSETTQSEAAVIQLEQVAGSRTGDGESGGPEAHRSAPARPVGRSRDSHRHPVSERRRDALT